MSDEIRVEFRDGDVTRDPIAQWQLDRLFAEGLPPAAVRPDGTIDPARLPEGWRVVDGLLLRP